MEDMQNNDTKKDTNKKDEERKKDAAINSLTLSQDGRRQMRDTIKEMKERRR